MAVPAEIEREIAADLADMAHDPLGFVRWAFPWGTGELAGYTGPREWQVRVLTDIGAGLKAGGDAGAVILQAVASGHGIGKSALVAWIVLWALATKADAKVVVTANTDAQLRTKTWPEVAKWHRLALCAHWFDFTATSLHAKDVAHEKTWRADAIPWSENNTEAFAGLHNIGSRILLIFDEASAIADRVWEVAEGALTDERTEIIWCAFGNPTRNTGRFRECFGRLRHRWAGKQIDSRTVDGTNKDQIAKWVADYGEDSDFVRVRVRGEFPRAGSLQLIPSDVVREASEREATSTLYDPVIMGVDVARFGDDQSVICLRQGRDARTVAMRRYRSIDTMQLAGHVAAMIEKHQPDAVFVDETGIGGAVVDRLRQLNHRCIGVNNGGKPDGPVEGELVANKGAECWVRCKRWLIDGGAIENDRELTNELESREYGYNLRNEIVLERKDDMKKRGLSSPDTADALCLTFAHPVGSRHNGLARGMATTVADYDPYV